MNRVSVICCSDRERALRITASDHLRCFANASRSAKPITKCLATARLQMLVMCRSTFLVCSLLCGLLHSTGQSQVLDPAPISLAASSATPITVTGTITDSTGNPVVDAEVIVVRSERARSALPLGLYLINGLPFQHSVTSSVRTDQSGRYLVELTMPVTGGVDLFAAAPSFGLAAKSIDRQSEITNIDMKLPSEHAVRGKLVDLNGVPVIGAHIRAMLKVDVTGLSLKDAWRRTLNAWHPEGLSCWKAVESDDQGRFLLRGLSDAEVTLQVEGPRVANFQTTQKPLPINDPKSTTISLSPANTIRGTVVYGDTGKLAANATIINIGSPVSSTRWAKTVSDNDGRFVINPFVLDPSMRFGPPANYLQVHAPADQAYCVASVAVDKPSAADREIKVTLDRGTVVKGRVFDKDSAEAIAGARIQFCHNRKMNIVSRSGAEATRLDATISRADGTYELCFPIEDGHLLVIGPTLEFLKQEITYGELNGEGIAGRHVYADAIIPISKGTPSSEIEQNIELQRGKSLRGQVVDESGEPVPSFLVVTSSYNANGYEFTEPTTLYGFDGEFVIPGCDSKSEVEVSIYDPQSKRGSTTRLNPTSNSAVTNIQLLRCGTAAIRLINSKNVPTPNRYLNVMYVLRDPATADESDAAKRIFDADYGAAAWLEPTIASTTDENGVLTIEQLVPGLTYRIASHSPIPGGPHPHKTFKVTAGQNVDLGDLVEDSE